MERRPARIDGRHTGRCDDRQFLKTVLPDVFQESRLSGAGFSGQKERFASLIYKLHCQLKYGIVRVGYHKGAAI